MANKARGRIAVLDKFNDLDRALGQKLPEVKEAYTELVRLSTLEKTFAMPNFVPTVREVGVYVAAEAHGAKTENREYMTSSAAAYLRATLECHYAWKLTKGIYQFDETLFDSLFNSKFETKVSPAITNLPEYAVMIAFPKPIFLDNRNNGNDRMSVGVVAKLTYTAYTDDIGLMYIIYNSDGSIFPMALGGLLEIEGVEKWLEENIKDAYGETPISRGSIVATAKIASGVLNILLYLCSEKPDINRPLPAFLPRIHPGKKHIKLPHQEQIYEVGYRIGAKIRAARAKEDAGWEASGETSRTRVTHIRRAHWHTYWTGSRKNNEMNPILKWLNPILVGDEELVPALHS